LVFEGDNESKIHETMRTKFPGRSFPHAKKKGKKNTKPNRREVKSWTANKNTRKRGQKVSYCVLRFANVNASPESLIYAYTRHYNEWGIFSQRAGQITLTV